MNTQWRNTLPIALPLAGLLLTSLTACTPHERYHRNLSRVHDQFHERPYTREEHRRLHETLDELHDDYHDRDRDGDRYYGGGYSRPW
jgi:hypothetical protein